MVIDLITIYNYQHMKKDNIAGTETFLKMRSESGWERDSRSTMATMIMKKVFQLSTGEFFRVMIRFSLTNSYEHTYELDQPMPFFVIKTTRVANGFKDIEVINGKKVKNVMGYIQKGVPVELFDKLSKDIKANIIYK